MKTGPVQKHHSWIALFKSCRAAYKPCRPIAFRPAQRRGGRKGAAYCASPPAGLPSAVRFQCVARNKDLHVSHLNYIRSNIHRHISYNFLNILRIEAKKHLHQFILKIPDGPTWAE